MHDVHVTLIGNVVSDVRTVQVGAGVTVASFRMAVTPRRYEAESGRWVDRDSTYITVECWRGLGDNVASSVHKGDPVLVIGRLRTHTWQQGDQRRQENQVEARWVGHDLCRGSTRFARTPRGEQLVPERDRQEAMRRLAAEATRAADRDATRDAPRDATRDAPRDAPRDTTRDAPRDTPRDAPRDTPRDTPRDDSRDDSRDGSGEGGGVAA